MSGWSSSESDAGGPVAAAAAEAAEKPRSRRPAPSRRTRVTRLPARGDYDRETIDAILDEGVVGHLGIADDEGQPFVIPTMHARVGDEVYVHGSAASRTLRALRAGRPACLTVTLFDGFVLARSAFNHSANYRSVVVLGEARELVDPEEKRQGLEALVERIVPGRWADVRKPTEKELKATSILALTLDEASAKVREGPPADEEEDYELDIWAGLIPSAQRPAAPVPDPKLREGIPLPGYLREIAG